VFCSISGAKKLWCESESTTNYVPVLRIAASRGFSELSKNLMTLSHGHSTHSLKISCILVQPFSRNLANKERKIETKKLIENNTPSPSNEKDIDIDSES